MTTIRALSMLAVVVAPLVACSAGSSDDSVQGDPQALTECDANGTWAIRVSVPVKWNPSFVVQGGSGTVTNWLKTKRVQNGLEVTDTAEICGVETPDYTATPLFGAEKYGVRFPDSTFGTLPTFELKGTVSSKEVGATFTAPASAALVGATLPNALTDAWPRDVGALTAQDVDNDTKPGLTGNAASGTGFSNPPVNPTRTVRAKQVYAAFRQVLEASTGTVKSCDRVEGTAKIAVIAGKAAIDSHVMGCLREDGTECAAAEFKLLDTAAPVYTPTADATITMVKLPAGATATCADARAAAFAPATP